MKERLGEMLKGTDIRINRLKMGTFHSICVRILRQYGHLIGLKTFKIAADRDWDDVMKSVIDPLTDEISEVRDLIASNKLDGGKFVDLESKSDSKIPYDIKKVKKQISSLKSKGIYPDDYLQQAHYNRELHAIYKAFQTKLEEKGLLDFDDLLAKTNQLLSKRHCLSNIRHVLIDEFQDTNTVQLELMCKFARGTTGDEDNVTVVGDPDQGIYRFRDAVALNFDLMRKKYPQCKIIKLNENYRSTSDVLNFSEALMRQQSSRTKKSLVSQFRDTFPPVYQTHPSRGEEAEAIADEIWHLKSLPGLFRYSDFAVLIRSAHLSRAVEQALVKRSIPYMIVKGRAFWERKEVEIVVDFLRLAAYDDDSTALLRLLPLFTSGIGPVTMNKIERIIDHQRTQGLNSIETLQQLSTGELKGLTARIQQKAKDYLKMIHKVKSFVANDKSDVKTLSELFDFITSQGALAELVKDDKERAENLKEVKAQLLEFKPVREDLINSEDSDPVEIVEETFLQNFISSIQLYLTDNKSDKDQGAVCISTIHSSKGLEWPVVFVPGLCEGSMPSKHVDKDENAEEALDEERRVLYVSTTRAKQLLYISTPLSSSAWMNSGGPSRFLTKSVLDLAHEKQKALSSEKHVVSLYNALGALYNDGEHQASVKTVLKSYEKLLQDRAARKAASEFSDDITSTFGNGNKSNTFFSRPAQPKEVKLPGPGVKNYAPSATPGMKPVNNTGILERRRTGYRSWNTRFVSTNRSTPNDKAHDQSLNLDSHNVPALSKTNLVQKVSGVESSTPVEKAPQVVKKRKTLGVRRRMPLP